MKKEKVILLLGSNVGNKIELLKLAQNHIQNKVGNVKISSSIYITGSWGPIPQDDFLNQIIIVETIFPPKIILQKILQIETILGRKRVEKYGPRTIDIDILFYQRKIINSTELNIPHLQIQNRNFVLTPLVELIPNFIHPVLNESLKNLKDNLKDNLKVEKWKK